MLILKKIKCLNLRVLLTYRYSIFFYDVTWLCSAEHDGCYVVKGVSDDVNEFYRYLKNFLNFIEDTPVIFIP